MWPLFTNMRCSYLFHSVGTLSNTYSFYCAGGWSLEESIPLEWPYCLELSTDKNELYYIFLYKKRKR